jgi:hypothetical protein
MPFCVPVSTQLPLCTALFNLVHESLFPYLPAKHFLNSLLRDSEHTAAIMRYFSSCAQFLVSQPAKHSLNAPLRASEHTAATVH